MSRLKLFIPFFVFIVMAGFLLRGLWLDPSELPSALIGKPVPTFSLPALETEKTLTNKDLAGEAFLINVWATWCPSCRVEHPYLNKLAEQGVKIYGLNYKDAKKPALRWLEKLGNPYQVNIFDKDGKLGLDLGVYGAPETFVVNSEGIIVYKHVGVVNEKVWRGKIAPLMN